MILLSPDSRELTTFITPTGHYCFNRLPFRISSACEVYQKRMSKILAGIPGVQCMIDDVLIYGKDQEEHYSRLRLVLQRLKDAGVTLNKNKCEFSKSSLQFLEHVIVLQGILPDPDKVDAIKSFEKPSDTTGLEVLLEWQTTWGNSS